MRLGDTGLLIQVEKDYCGYGGECKFGDGMDQAAGIGQGNALALVRGDKR